MALQLDTLAHGQGWAAVSKRIEGPGGKQSPFSTGFSNASHLDSAIVKDHISDPDCHHRGNTHGNANHQTFVNVAHSKPRVWAGLSVGRGYGREAREHNSRTKGANR